MTQMSLETKSMAQIGEKLFSGQLQPDKWIRQEIDFRKAEVLPLTMQTPPTISKIHREESIGVKKTPKNSR